MNQQQKKTRRSNKKPSPQRLDTKDDASTGVHVLLKSSDEKKSTTSRKKEKSPTQRKKHLFNNQSLKDQLQLITDTLLTLQDIDYVAMWMRKPADSCVQKEHETKKGKGKTRAPEHGYLHLVASSGHLPHIDENDYQMIPADQGLMGKVMSQKSRKYHLCNIDHQSLAQGERWIQQAGFVSFTGYQLHSVDNKPSGVLAVFGHHSLTPMEQSLLEIAVAATHHILLSDVPVYELVETRELYNALYNRSLFWIYRHDLNGNLIAANKTFLDEMGFTEKEIPHININTLITDKTQVETAHHIIKEIIKYGHTKKPFELKARSKNGEEFWAEGDSSLIYREGKPYAIQGIAQDITQRKKTEILLQQSEERFRRFFECSPDYCYMISPKGTIININKSALELHGIKKEEAVGKQIVPIAFPNSSRPTVEKLIQQYTEKGTVQNEEINIKTGTGEERTVLLSADEVKDSKGEILYYILVQKDITDRKKQQVELSKSYELLLRVIDNLLVGMVIIDPENHHIIDANPIALELLETTREELMGTPCHNFFCLKEPGICPITDLGKDVDVSESHLRTAKGKDRILLKKVIPIPFLEKTYLIESFMDITESKASLEKLKKRTKELLKSRKEYRELINGMNDTAWVINFDGKFMEVNNAAVNNLRYSKEELLSMGPTDIDPNLKPGEVKNLIENMEKDQLQVFETIHETKDGIKIPVEISSTLVTYHGETAILSVARDITERKKEEEKLKNLSSEKENILNAAADGLRIISCDFNVKSMNKTMAELAGIRPQDREGMKCHEMFNSPGICGTDACFLKRVLTTGKGFTRQGVWKTPTGESIHCLNVITPFRNSSGEVIGVIEDFRDITTIKKVEDELQVERQQLLSIFDSINEAIYVADPHTYTILYANTCLKERYKDDLVGKTCYKVLYDNEKPCVHCTNALILEKKGEPYTWQFHNPRTNREYDVTNRMIQWPDGRDVRFELAIDVTKKSMALKELEEAHDLLYTVNKELERKVKDRTAEIARLIEQKDEFINQLGHDLKTPLTPMMALLPQLKESHNKPEELDKILDILTRNVYYMKELVNNTIELAKLNSQRTDFCMEDLQLSSEVENIIHTNKFLFDRNNITVKNNIPPHVIVHGDKLRLKEIFNNLLTNAVKYTADNKGSVTIDAKEKDNMVLITLRDKGIGMTPAQIGHIFDEFYKADDSRSDLDSHGLGLTICKRIVEKHGGSIGAKSQGPGKGTTMCFTLPKGKDQQITVALKE